MMSKSVAKYQKLHKSCELNARILGYSVDAIITDQSYNTILTY
jgi:hypothetical protein